MVVCGHRDCDVEFTPDKTRYKFCCPDCYKWERTKRLNDENRRISEERARRKKILKEECNKLKKIETKKEKLSRRREEKARLKVEVIGHFGEPVGAYTFNEIAEFMGLDKRVVERIYRSAMKKIGASKQLEEAFWH